MEEKTDYFKTLRKISRAFGTTLDRDELLELIVQSAIDTMNAKAASLFLIDEEINEFVRVAQKGLSENYFRLGLTQPEKIAPVLLKEGYLFSRDATTDTRLEHHEIKEAEGIASILVVPVMVKGRLIGGLSLFTGKPRDFSHDEIDFLTALAEQGGMAIEHSRLFDQLRENTKMFLDLAASINSSLDLEKVLHILSANVAEAIGVKASSVRLLDENKDTLELAASYGLSEKYINKGPVSAEEGPNRELIQGKPLVLRNALTDKGVRYRKEMKEEGIVSILSVPIRAREDVIGVLRLYSAVQREFAEDEIMLITALAHAGGMAIENARLFDQIGVNTRLFLDLAAGINSSLDLKKILHILSADIAEVMKVKASSILLIDQAKQTLEIVASSGLSEKYLDRGPLSVEKSIAETLEGKPVLVIDATTDRRVQYKKEKEEEGIVSILSLPIKTKEEVIGVLRLYTGVRREFTEGEIMLVTALAHLGGLAIQNASLYGMLQEDMDDLKDELWSHRSWF